MDEGNQSDGIKVEKTATFATFFAKATKVKESFGG
jgi:hypothetical protein